MIAIGSYRASILRVLQDLDRVCSATIRGNVLIQKKSGSHPPILTRDGMNILHEYPLEKPVERLVGGIVRQSALNLHREVGDGVKTFVRLTRDIFQAFANEELSREDEEQLYFVCDYIADNYSQPCKSSDLAYQVAYHATKGDDQAASLLAEAVELIGKTGRLQFEDGVSMRTEIKYSEGYLLEDCFVPSELLQGKTERTLESPLVAVIKDDLHQFDHVQSLLETATQWPLPLVIITPLAMREALATVLQNDKEGVKEAVVFSPRRDAELQAILEDLAAYSGSEVVDPKYHDLRDFQAEWLGAFRKITLSHKTCKITPFQDKLEGVLQYTKKLSRQAESSDSLYNQDRILRRIAALTDGLCLIQVGGATEAERKNTRSILETATKALQSAISSGILTEICPYRVMGESLQMPRLSEKLLKYNSEPPMPTEVFRAVVYKAVSTAKLLLHTRAWIYK